MHTTRGHRRPLAVPAAALVTGLSLVPGPAQADHELIPPGELVAAANDTRSVGRCDFTVESYDGASFHGRLAGQVRPNSLLHVFSNKYTQVRCEVFDADGFLVAHQFRGENSAYIQRHADEVTVPVSDGYRLCASVATVTAQGQIFDATSCEDSF